jgi:hypothetical protein
MLLATSTCSSDDVLHVPNDSKFATPNQLFYRQPHSIQIIKLDECAPPPPRDIMSYYSSSCSSSYTSEDDESEDDEDCSSYCSSDLPPENPESSSENDASMSGTDGSKLPTEMYSTVQRILAWRENFSTGLDARTSTFPSKGKNIKLTSFFFHQNHPPYHRHGRENPSLQTLMTMILYVAQRFRSNFSSLTLNHLQMSHTSKRSRSHLPSEDTNDSDMKCLPTTAATVIDAHCSACDASFPTTQSFREHASINEACGAAVEYAFES